MDTEEYLRQTAATRAQRLRWWQEARFGMFIHWGLYSQLGRHEWVMNRERIPAQEYEKLADTWKPLDRPAREWARLAREAGMKYMVMTTKHCEGYCLWDTQQTDYNSVKHSPGRDLVREYVEACREYGLKIGFYYVFMDWYHPDARLCHADEGARRRYIDYVRGCVRELMGNYGPIDILWWDAAWPVRTPEKWETAETNAMVRALQPHILMNNRSWLDEDFGTPEEQVTAECEGRAWEACMTFNGSWGYMPSAIDWHPVREVLGMLRTTAGGQGNLLLNVGPAPDGSLPPEAAERLIPVGRWVAQNGEALYGQMDRADGQLEWMPCGQFTRKGNTAYFWCKHWPGRELAFGGFQTKLLRASYLATGKPITFEQAGERLILKGLPDKNPDEIAGVCVIKMEFDDTPKQVLGAGLVVL